MTSRSLVEKQKLTFNERSLCTGYLWEAVGVDHEHDEGLYIPHMNPKVYRPDKIYYGNVY